MGNKTTKATVSDYIVKRLNALDRTWGKRSISVYHDRAPFNEIHYDELQAVVQALADRGYIVKPITSAIRLVNGHVEHQGVSTLQGWCIWKVI